MNYRKDYTTKKNTSATARAVLLFLVGAAVVILLSVMMDNKRPVEPDVTYPMANANISWDQSFYGWSDAT